MLSAAMIAAACGGDAEESAGNGDTITKATGRAVLSDRAIVLDDAALAALTTLRPDGDRVALTFDGSSEQLDAIELDSVVIFGPTALAPNGALLEVESLERADAALSLIAHRAEMTDAFEELEVQVEGELASPGDVQKASSTRQALGVALPFRFRGSGDNGSEVSGSLAVDSSIGFTIDFSIDEGLQELSVGIEASETFSAELIGQGESTFEEEIELASTGGGVMPIVIVVPIPFPPGTVPVVLTPQVVLAAGVRGVIRGEMEASAIQEASFSAGLGFVDGDFGTSSDSESSFQFNPPTFEAGASLRAWAGPRLEVLLYGAVGPFVSVAAFVELAAQVEGPPPCVTGVVNAGVTGEVGVDILATYRAPVLDQSEPIAAYDSCREDDDPNAPRPAITWSRTFGREGSPGEAATAVIETADGSYIVVGHSSLFDGITGFAAATWVMRLDPLGNVIWQRAFWREGQGLVRGLAEVPGGFLVAGTSGVMKLDDGGNPIWAKRYDEDALVVIASIAAQSDGRFVVSGTFGTESHAWAMGLDDEGDVLWSRSYEGADFSRVRATADGGYVVVGKVWEAFDISVVKLDAEGELRWARTVDNLFDPNPAEGDTIATSDDRAYDIAEKPDGGYVIVGDAYGNFPLPEPTPVGFYGTWVVELDEDGGLGAAGSVTHRAPMDSLYGGAYAVAVRPDGSNLIVGRRADTSADLLVNEDILMIQGIGYRLFGGAGHDHIDGGTLSGIGRGMPLALTRDGGAILAATSDSFSDREQLWLLKLNRTASINIPERSNATGSSFVNGEAQSIEYEASPIDQTVTAVDFTAELNWETTELVSEQQAP